MTGTIKNVVVDKGFGFIAAPGTKDVFFYHLDLVDIAFDASIVELPVEFDIRDMPKGPRASNVRKAS